MDKVSFEKVGLQFLDEGQFDDLLNHYQGYLEGVGKGENPRIIWQKLVTELEARSRAEGSDSHYVSECLYTAGLVWHHHLARRDRAMAAFQKAFKTHTANTKALKEARGIYLEQNNLPMVMRLYELEAQVTKVPERQADLQVEMGDLMLRMDNEDGAETAFKKAVDLHPDHQGATDGLARIQAIRADWPTMVEKCLQEAESADRMRALNLRMKAVEILLREDPTNDDISRQLQLVMDLDPRNTRSIRLLVEHYRATGDLDKAGEAVSARLGSITSKEERLDLVRHLASMFAEAGDDNGAARYHSMVLELDPGNVESLEFIKDTATRYGQWDLLVEGYEKALKLRRKSSEELTILLDLANIHWKRREDFDSAEKYFRRIKLSDPRNPAMLDFYRAYYYQAGDWKRLLSALAGLQQSEEDPAHRIALAREMAEIAEDKLESPDKAADVWKSVLRMDPDHQEARENLKRIYTSSGKWNALLEIYKEEIQKLPDADILGKIEIYNLIVAIYRDQLNLDVMVINTYNAILALDPTNEAALDALAEKFESAGRWNDLVGILQKKAQNTPSVTEQCELLHRVADLWLTKFSNASQALKPLEEILALDEADGKAIESLEKIYRQRRDWKGLLSVLRKKVAISSDEDQLHLYEEMAVLAAEKTGKVEESIELWEARLEAGAIQGEPLPAHVVDALDRLYTQTGRREDLIALVRRQVNEGPQETEPRTAALRRLGQLLNEAQGREDESLDVWQQVLEENPADKEAVGHIRNIYRARQDWDSLYELFSSIENMKGYVALLKEASDQVREPGSRLELLERIARIALEELEDEAEAVSAHEQMLALDPTNTQVAEFLAPIYERSGEWRSLAGVLEILVSHGDSMERPDRTLALQQIYEGKLKNKAEAFNWAARLYQEQPDERTAAELSRLAAETDRWEELVQLYRMALESDQVTSDPVMAVRTHLDIGRVCMERLGWIEDAIQSYTTAADLDMDSLEALDALEKLYASTERWEDLVQVNNRRADLVTDEADRAAIFMQVGNIYENILDDAYQSIDAYHKVLDQDPAHLEALAGLARMLERVESWEDLASTLERWISSTADADERVDLTLRLAQTNEDRLFAIERAVELYGEVLEAQPGNETALSRLEGLFGRDEEKLVIAGLLEPVYRQKGDWERLVIAMEVIAEASVDPEFRMESFQKMARIHEEKLRSTERALEAIKRAFAEAADNRDLWKEAERLADRADDWRSVADLYAAALGELADGNSYVMGDEDRVDLGLRLADIRESRLGEDRQAVDTCERVLDSAPDCMAAIERLEKLNGKLQDWEALVGTLERKASLVTDVDPRLAILFQICALLEDVIGDNDRAVEVYNQILDTVPDNMQALVSLERLHGGAARWNDLAEVLRRQVASVEEVSVKAEAMFRLGQTLQNQLMETDESVQIYQELLEEKPGHEQTVATLESMLASPPESVMDPDGTQRLITEILEPSYKHRDEWDRLAAVYEIRLNLSDSPDEKVELLSAIARLHEENQERGGELAAAFDATARALLIMPDGEELRGELERLAMKLGDPGALVTALAGAADSPVIDTDSAVWLLRKAAHVAAEALGEMDESITLWRRLRDLEPEDKEALDALDQLLTGQERFDEVVEVLEAKISLAESDDDRITLLMRLGSLFETTLEDVERAIENYRGVLDIDVAHPQALDSLEKVFIRLERWEELIPVFQARIDAAADDAARKELYRSLATLQEERLENNDEAIAAYLTILEVDPEDYDAVLALVHLYNAEERYPDLLEILDRQASMLSFAQEKAAVRLQQGLLLRDHLEDPLGSIDYFTQVLDLTGNNQDAIDALESLKGNPDVRGRVTEVLEPVYLKAAAWAELTGILEVRLLDTEDVEDRVELLWKLADLYENKLEDLDLAFDSLTRAFMEQHSNAKVLKNLERLAADTGRWTDMVAALLAGTAEQLDGEVLTDLFLLVARIEYRELEDVEAARDHFSQALEMNPACTDALDALELIHSQTNDWSELLEVYRRKTEIAASDRERIGLFMKMASLQEEVLDQADGAMESYQNVLNLDPDHDDAYDCLESLLRREERFYDLVSALSGRLSRLEEREGEGHDNLLHKKQDVKHRLGCVYGERLGDLPAALDTFRDVLQAEEAIHQPTVEALERLNEQENGPEEIARLLEPVYRKTNRWEDLTGVLATVIASTVDMAERKRLLLDSARINEQQLERLESAFDNLAAALPEDPDDLSVRDELIRLAGELGNWEPLVDHLDGVVDTISSENHRIETIKLIADVCDDKLADYHRSLDLYRRALDLDDNDQEVLTALEKLYTRLEQWADLVDIYQHKADRVEEPAQKIELHFRMCNLLEEVLDDPDRAILTYHTILDLEPDNRNAFRNLERILQSLERWEEMADILSRQLEFTEAGEPRAALRHRLAELTERRLERPEQAVEYYREVLEEAEAYQPSIDALERMLDNLGLESIDERLLRLTIVSILEPIYTSQENWNRLLGLIWLKLEQAEEVEEQIALLRSAAALQAKKLTDPVAAFATLTKAQELDFSNPKVRTELMTLAEAMDNWERFAAVYVEGLEKVDDAEVAATMLRTLAQVFNEKLGHKGNSIACYRKLLEIDNSDMETVNALEGLYTETGNSTALVEILKIKADFAEEALERKELLYRICEIWDEQLGNQVEAIHAYRAVLEVDPEDLVAIEALERLYREEGEWTELVALLHEKAELMESDESRVAILFQVAAIQDQFLSDGDASLDSYRSILNYQPDNIQAMAAMQTIFQREERWPELLDAYQMAFEVAEDDEARDSLQALMGDLLRVQLDDPTRALEEYREVLGRTALHPMAISGLEHLLADEANRIGAARLLEPCYEATEQWENLAIVLEMLTEDTFDPEERVALFKRIASIREKRLEDLDGALDILGRAFREAPGEESLLRDVDRLAGATGQLPGLAELVSEMASSAPDPMVGGRLMEFVARLYHLRLEDPENAISWYAQVLENDDVNKEALAALDKLYTQAEDWSRLAEILERRITAAGDSGTAPLRFRQAQLQETIFMDVARAVENYRAILWEEPSHEEARQALVRLAAEHTEQRLAIGEILEPLFKEDENWQALVELLESRMQIMDLPLEKAELSLAVGRLHADRLSDPRRAFHWFRLAVDADPSMLEGLDAMESLVEDLDGWPEFAEALEKAAASLHDPDQSRRIMLKLARVRQKQMYDPEGAEQSYRQILEDNPEDGDALEALANLYESGRKWESLLDIIQRQAELSFEVDDRKEQYRRMAVIASEQLDDPARAEEGYLKILEMDEGDGDALLKLEEIYDSQERKLDLVEILMRRVAGTTDDAQLVKLQLRIGTIREELGDEEGALEGYRNALDLAPEDAEALESLGRMYEVTERHMELADILQQQLELADGGEQKVKLLKRLAVVASEHLDDYEGAMDYLKQVVAEAPEDREADSLLEKMLARHGRYDELIGLLEGRLERVEEPADRVPLLLQLAGIHQEGLNDTAKAGEILQGVLEVEPENITALGILGRIHQQDGNWEAALGVMERQLEVAERDGVAAGTRAEMLVEKGRVLLQQLGDSDGAVQSFRAALELDPDNSEAVQALQQVYQEGDNWQEYLGLLRHRSDGLVDLSQRLPLLKEMAVIATDRLADPATAVEALEQAVAIDPEDMEVTRPLAEAYLEAGELDKARPVLDNLIEGLKEARRFKELPIFHHQLGLLAEKMGDDDEALSQFSAAHDLDATYLPNLASLGRLHYRHQEWDRALKVFQTMLLHQAALETADERVDIYYHLGQVRLQLGDERRARDMFNRALSINPEHIPSREALGSDRN